jgi:Uma2 family endonuclease
MSSAQPARRAWTYGNLAALPGDHLRHELIDGEHVVTPSPLISHQVILWNLVEVLGPYLRASPIGTALAGPVDVKFSPFTVLVPDLVYFTAERFARVVNDRCATAAPDLVVEILSPGTRRRDKGRKRAVYDREGVGEYWIVDPESRSITALRRPRAGCGLTDVTTLTLEAGGVLESPLFPSLRLPLLDVFRGR